MSARQFKSFFDKYHSYDDIAIREAIDNILSEIAKKPSSSEYKWNVITLTEYQVIEITRALSSLQSSLVVKPSKKDKAQVVLSWSGQFNVPAQYFWEKSTEVIKYAPVVRAPFCGPVKKSSKPKNPWSGRLRAIASVDYVEHEQE
jgi:hypothetical protein